MSFDKILLPPVAESSVIDPPLLSPASHLELLRFMKKVERKEKARLRAEKIEAWRQENWLSNKYSDDLK
jgi:hypothetical protein